MMPYIQGEPDSIPDIYAAYSDIIRSTFIKSGDIGFLTIDESVAEAGRPHRGKRAKFDRALHTEVGIHPNRDYVWGGGWATDHVVTLDADVEILLANNLDDSCAVWDTVHMDTSRDGDIGHLAEQYSYANAEMMKAGAIRRIGIFTPHESLPVPRAVQRQFLRIISSGVHGREPYFTQNLLLSQ